MSEPTAIPASGNAEVDPNAARDSFLRRWRWWLIAGGPLLILAIVAYFVLTSGRYQTTDNAYVQIAKVPVAPSIGGRITDIYVHENQFVRRGQVLFRLDARDYQANAQAAAATVANAALQVNAMRASYQQQQATVQAARETLAYTTSEATRQRNLAAGPAERRLPAAPRRACVVGTAGRHRGAAGREVGRGHRQGSGTAPNQESLRFRAGAGSPPGT